jgi:monoamine oxidase
VLLPTVVKGVTDKASSVSVTLANGTELTADYVIVTVPLGVLKEDVIKFTPPLPADKQTAIKNMVSRGKCTNTKQHSRGLAASSYGRALRDLQAVPAQQVAEL